MRCGGCSTVSRPSWPTEPPATEQPYNVTESTPPWGLAVAKPQGAFLYQRNGPTDQGKKEKMSTTIYRTEDPALETVEFGSVYRIRAPRTGEPWNLYKVADDCGVRSIEPLDVPDGWDDSREYAMADTRIWPRLTRLAMDADLAHAILEVTIVPVDDEEADANSRALLYRFTWPY